jgi:hypothetical protein
VHGVENTQEYPIENTGVEMDFENEGNEKVQEGGEISVCTKELRDWSLQLTGNDSLVITGNVDKWVFDKFVLILFFSSSCIGCNKACTSINNSLIFLLPLTLLIYVSSLSSAISLSSLRLSTWSSYMYVLL